MSLFYSTEQTYSAGEHQQGCPTPLSGSSQLHLFFRWLIGPAEIENTATPQFTTCQAGPN